jgi:hypothetical protein
MSDIIKKYYFLGFLVALHWSGVQLSAQIPEKYRSIKLMIGGGYGYYFNTFTNVLDQDVVNSRPVFSAKLLWQPEHRLRVGIESGYYFMYSTTRVQTDNGSDVLTTSLNVIPMFITFSMRIIDHFELNFASGWASMIYYVSVNKSKKNMIVGHMYSMSNFSAGCGYYIPLGKRFDLGAELKYLYLGKSDDHHMSFMINMSYKIFAWKVK